MNDQDRIPPTRTPEGTRWLAENPTINAGELEQVWQLTETARPHYEQATFDPNKISIIESRIAHATRPKKQPINRNLAPPLSASTSKLKPKWSGIKTAALVCMTLICIAVGYLFAPLTFSASLGDRLEVELPDGSVAILNSGAVMQYNRLYGWIERDVELQGEAYFDVQSTAQTFRVNTFNASVTVLGTRFNVRAWETDAGPGTEVSLETGRVLLSSTDAPQFKVELEPGQKSRLPRHSTRPEDPVEVSFDRETVWRSGGFAFVNQPVHDILDEIKRRFDIDIEVEPTLQTDQRVSLYRDRADRAEDVIGMICPVIECEIVSGTDRLILRSLR